MDPEGKKHEIFICFVKTKNSGLGHIQEELCYMLANQKFILAYCGGFFCFRLYGKLTAL